MLVITFRKCRRGVGLNVALFLLCGLAGTSYGGMKCGGFKFVEYPFIEHESSADPVKADNFRTHQSPKRPAAYLKALAKFLRGYQALLLR